MQILAVDGRAGASGDMLLGALIDAGADPDALAVVEDSLGVTYAISETTTGGIAATDVTVCRADGDGEGDETDAPNDDETDAAGTPIEGQGPHRTLDDVLAIVEAMDLPAGVAARATAIFERLDRAERAVHGSESVHFHEVGADDAIADVVGVALLLDDLAPDRIVTTPLALGDGTVEMAHGTHAVPAPAVAELASEADFAVRGGPVEGELLTPTGAAILAEVAEGVDRLPTLSVEAVGHGAGDRDLGDRPNALRVLRGTATGGLRKQSITVLETNLDDATPEVLGSLQETLIDEGARDVTIVPVTMKKSRPGHLVKVVVAPEDADRVARRLAAETGTLGIREHGVGHRWVADRETRSVEITVDGEEYAIGVKVASDDAGGPIDASAEYDDALRIARETGRPVRAVMALAERACDRS
ncbi:nickel pincer cofactor biosynthesis protein LarC [Halococcoides cellulosivorans]|uniref:Putative nickel insertion protein n=1 Tax=Halococcoides cellulosivorans TaxID=1679096 RepID=A0A2R4WZC5_9EURY|nr:nickel pincer cofactor biosynthesis protein LarC [Halococcoides cellulosivorans]AWB26893.1 nickel pincer cofactor biosynthesis protein LarC [Halococcoides cellulosivorans]